MVTLALALVLAQVPSPVRVTVIDVSEQDAIYEDVSRALAEALAKFLGESGFEASRVDESEFPEFPCPPGPCLAKVARMQKAHVLVTLDAKEVDKTTTAVGLTALLGTNGMPLAGARYTLKAGQKKAPKELTAFPAKLLAQVAKAYRPVAPPDGGTKARGDAGTQDAGR